MDVGLPPNASHALCSNLTSENRPTSHVLPILQLAEGDAGQNVQCPLNPITQEASGANVDGVGLNQRSNVAGKFAQAEKTRDNIEVPNE